MRGSSHPASILIALVVIGCGGSTPPDQAIAYGAGSCGKLEGGVPLPCSGDGYEAFSALACWLGRTYLHPLAVDTVVDAYAVVAATYPQRTWQYGEMGWEEGGAFAPHKTHQNGLAADFFFPVVDGEGGPGSVPISLFNTFGYDLDFDANGRLEDLRIDWRALADHLIALERAGKEHGVGIKRIILAPTLQRALLRHAPAAQRFAGRFNKKRAWVLHDEHYHVDFTVPGRARAPLSCR